MSIDNLAKERRVKLYENYAKLRDARNMTDYEVSKQTGIATATLSNWKNGNYTPKLEKLKAIAAFFEVPLSAIVGEV